MKSFVERVERSHRQQQEEGIKKPRDAAPPDCLIPIKRDCETTSPHKISQLEGNKTQLSL